MDEIEEVQTRSLEWGCVCNLIDKIGGIEDKIEGGWDELINMLADDVIGEDSWEKDTSRIFFVIYAFVFRLYYRLKANPEKRPFDVLSKVTISGEEYFRITNYSYKTFKWATSSGLGDMISNNYMDIPSSKLTEQQIRAFSRRIKKEEK